MGLIDAGLKLGSKALTLGGKVFGVGKNAASWSNKYSNIMGKKTLVQKAAPWAAGGQLAARVGGYIGASKLLQSAIGDAGPEGDEFTERAMNQLRYGVDMTDAQMEAAIEKGQQFQDTGAIGEGGLNEAQVRQFLAQRGADQRGAPEKWASAGLSAVAMYPGLGTLIGTPAEMIYDKYTGDTRREQLKGAVGSLQADLNEMNVRKNMEKNQGKFMTEGLMGKNFGKGNVRMDKNGGIKPPVDKAAQEEEAAALKEYEAIKAKDGVFAAISSPAAAKAGRQVYLDVQEASGGNKDTAEALLSGAGLTDQATAERYYGNPEASAKANEAQTAKIIAQRTAEAAARQTEAEKAKTATLNPGGSAGLNLAPAKNADEVRANQAAISAERGYYGQSPIANEQQSYLNANGMKTSTQLNSSLSDPGWQALLARHQENLAKGREQFKANRAAAADREYDKFIVKPGDKGYALGKKETLPGMQAVTVEGAGAAPNTSGATAVPANTSAPAPAPAPAPLPNQVNAAAVAPTPKPTVPFTMSPTPYGVGTANRGTGIPQFNLPDIGGAMKAAGEAFGNKVFPQSLPGQSPMVMRPTPNGLGGTKPGIPQLPDIGAPGRAMGEAVGNKLFPQSIPAKPASPMTMSATPYGLGTATPGIPQVPDIGASARAAGESMANKVIPQSLPGNPATPPAMSQSEIAKLIAKQKEEEANRVKGMKMPAPGGLSPRFRHPAQVPNNRPY